MVKRVGQFALAGLLRPQVAIFAETLSSLNRRFGAAVAQPLVGSPVLKGAAVMTDVAFASAAELALMIRNRKVSPVEVVRTTLARIEQTEPMLECVHHCRGRTGDGSRQSGRGGFSELTRWLPPTAAGPARTN